MSRSEGAAQDQVVLPELGGPEVIRFDGVAKTFTTKSGEVEAAHDINLIVRKGEFITIVGPSGCGKSTLLNMAAGIFPPTRGQVRYCGQVVTTLQRKVGYITQNDHLLPWRTIASNIAVPLEIQGVRASERKRKVEELMALVGLEGFADNYPSQLSGGMRKRTNLARLLAYDPETLLLDEPFAALDAQLRLQMQIEIRRLSRALNKTAMLVTHDLDEAVALGDRCVVFTPRPGTIRKIVDIPLPGDRTLRGLRRDPVYNSLTATLWDELTPEASVGGN